MTGLGAPVARVEVAWPCEEGERQTAMTIAAMKTAV